MRSPRSGRSSRAPISGAQPQPSRCSVAFAVHAPSRSRQSGSSKRREQPLGDRAAAPPPLRPRSPAAPSPSARLSPAAVGTAKRAGWTKANSSSRSRPDKFRIAEPLPDQRRVEDDVRRLGRPRDRFAAARLPHLASRRLASQMPRMGCVRAREEAKERPSPSTLGRWREQKSNAIWTPNTLRSAAMTVEGLAL